ncbi:MAG TPA: DUF2510 domain-containing protein [Nocardioides sp.]|uniref:DUF2510 domain-containing protein n=1 Tax=Nocardioides sp. TaxID=35761 RepID=UPI002B6BC65F|nr:DUF2510 domain-containing protein [Nocardioides sp.]HTW17099.1 DUF2510 domain-containing protein [Nocardioides sp.]
MSNAPAGWYPNPGPEGGQRFWDGEQWTDQQQPGASAAYQPPASPVDAMAKRRATNARTLKIFGGALGALLLIVIIGAAVGGDDEEPAASDSKSDAGASAAPPKADESPAAPPKPAKPIEQVQDAVDESDADDPTVSRWGGRGSWLVEFKVKDNLSMGMVRGGIAIDVFDIAEEISKLDDDVPVKEVAFRGTFPLVDKFGEEEDGQVFFTTFRGSDIRKINYDNVMTSEMDTVEALAIDNIVGLHPDFRD